MPVPNSELALVAQEKIIDYLLNPTHAIGGAKEKFFSAFGFDRSDVDTFRAALLQHAVIREVQKELRTPYGTKYKLICAIETPDKRNPCIVTVWIIDRGSDVPKLVTAYPE